MSQNKPRSTTPQSNDGGVGFVTTAASFFALDPTSGTKYSYAFRTTNTVICRIIVTDLLSRSLYNRCRTTENTTFHGAIGTLCCISVKKRDGRNRIRANDMFHIPTLWSRREWLCPNIVNNIPTTCFSIWINGNIITDGATPSAWHIAHKSIRF